MIRTQKTIRVFAILALVFILVGCTGPTAVVPPTPDIPSIRTEAVQTAVAKITIEAALNPSPTVEAPATPEPEATAIPEPTATEPSAPTAVPATSVPTLRPTTSGGGVAYPTATRRAGPDQAQLISQEPTDGTVFNPSSEFDGTWTFKNIGTSTWNSNYYYRVAKGATNLATSDRYYLGGNVKPGESVRLVADMVAPSTGGRTVTYWELCNDNGAVFYQFYLVVDVK